MTKEQILLRAAAEPIVTKVIKDMKTGSRRSIRNSIEIGISLSNNPLQKDFFTQTRKIFNKADDNYSQLVNNALENVSTDILKTVCLNLSISSFNVGTKQMQKNFLDGENNTWIEIIPTDKLIDVDLCKLMIKEYQNQGIYCFFINNLNTLENIVNSINIASFAPKSTFLLNITMDKLDNSVLNYLSRAQNIVLAISQNDKNKKADMFSCLRKHNLLFGFSKDYSFYECKEQENQLFHKMIAEGCLFGLYIDKPANANDYQDSFYQEICNSRISGKLPILLSEFYRDRNYVKNIILNKDTSLSNSYE